MNSKQTKTEKLTLRVSKTFIDQLEELCDTYALSKTGVIERLVFGEYVRVTERGKAEIKNILNQFETLQKTLENTGR